MAEKTAAGEGDRSAKPPQRVWEREPCPGLMDPRQLLHQLDQVVCSGLSLHPAAVIVLRAGGKEEGVQAAWALPRGTGCLAGSP